MPLKPATTRDCGGGVQFNAEMTGEVKNPEIRVKNHKNRYGCEFFSEKDIQAAISEIKRATIQYFNQ